MQTECFDEEFCIIILLFFSLSLLVNEINAYDQKTQEQEQSLRKEEMMTTVAVNKTRIKDYKKTSLLKAVTVFEEFLKAVEKAERNKKADNGKTLNQLRFLYH